MLAHINKWKVGGKECCCTCDQRWPDHLHNLKFTFRKLRSLNKSVGLMRSRSPPVPRLGHSITCWCCVSVNLNKSQTAFDFIRSHTDRHTIDLHLRSPCIQRETIVRDSGKFYWIRHESESNLIWYMDRQAFHAPPPPLPLPLYHQRQRNDEGS